MTRIVVDLPVSVVKSSSVGCRAHDTTRRRRVSDDDDDDRGRSQDFCLEGATSGSDLLTTSTSASYTSTMWRCSQLSSSRAEIDRYLLPAGPTAANPPHAGAAVDKWDRQTDGRTRYRYIDPAAYYASSVIKPDTYVHSVDQHTYTVRTVHVNMK